MLIDYIKFSTTFTDKPKINFITPNNQIADLSSTVTLRCDVEGQPRPNLFWEKQGDLDFKYLGNQLTLQQIKVEDKGVYICIAKNQEGEESGKVNVLVRRKSLFSFVLLSENLFYLLFSHEKS